MARIFKMYNAYCLFTHLALLVKATVPVGAGGTCGNHHVFVGQSFEDCQAQPHLIWTVLPRGSVVANYVLACFKNATIEAASWGNNALGRSWPMPSITCKVAPLMLAAVSRPAAKGTSGSAAP